MSQRGNAYLSDLDWQVRQAGKRRNRRGFSYLQLPVTRMPCEIVLTGNRRNKRLTVRCRCMAQTRDKPLRAYYNYDPLGEADTIREAVGLWKDHAGIAVE